MANIAVFCGSRENVNKHYIEQSEQLGRSIANRAHHLIYGGGIYGLMGGVYRGVRSNGGKVTGIIPRFLLDKERGSQLESDGAETLLVDTMDQRKSEIFRLSDAVITLPGGVGSLDELAEAMSLKQLERIQPKIGVLNTSGYYDQLIEFFRRSVNDGFTPHKTLDSLVIEENPQLLLERMGL